MTRARATALALVNWKGVFYERYLLDPNVTALEGANGAGKTTVMIAAYVVLMPDMSRLRFTNLGETAASGGDKGIWGRLGELGSPSYAVLEIALAHDRRLLAGVELTRKAEPSVLALPFLITDLPADCRLQDVLLRRSAGSDAVPTADELADNVRMSGGALHRFSGAKDYFAALFEHGVTPLRLSLEEDRSKFNEMLRTSMTGGISRALTSELRSFLLRAESSLGDTLSRMRQNLDACRRTRLEVSEAQRLEHEIAGVYEAGQGMFAAAMLATREHCRELEARASAARETTDQIGRELEALELDAGARKTHHEQLVGALKTKRAQLKSAVEQHALRALARSLSEQRRTLENEQRAASATVAEASMVRARVHAERAASLAERDRARAEYQASAQGLADVQRGLDELHRQAHRERRALEQLAELRSLLGEPSFGATDLPAALKRAEGESLRIADARLKLARDIELGELRHAEYSATARALAQITGEPEANGSYERGKFELSRLTRLAERKRTLGSLETSLKEGLVLAERQASARKRALDLGFANEAELDGNALTLALASAQRELSSSEAAVRCAETELERCRAERQSLELELATLNARAARRAEACSILCNLEPGAEPWTLERARDLLLRLEQERAEIGAIDQQRSARRDACLAAASVLEARGGSFSAELLRLREELDAELLVQRFDDLEGEDAALIEAQLGPLVNALLVGDPARAAELLAGRPRELENVWLVGTDAILVQKRPELRGADVIVKHDFGFRVSRLPDAPVLGLSARSERARSLRAEADDLGSELDDMQRRVRRLEASLRDLRPLVSETGPLAGSPIAPARSACVDGLQRVRVLWQEADATLTRQRARIAELEQRAHALRDLLADAFLLTKVDHAQAYRALVAERCEAEAARIELGRVSEALPLLESGLQALRFPGRPTSAAEGLELERAALDLERDRWSRILEGLTEFRTLAGFLDSNAGQRVQEGVALVPALEEQYQQAQQRLAACEAKLEETETDRDRVALIWQRAEGERCALLAQCARLDTELTRLAGHDRANFDSSVPGESETLTALSAEAERCEREERELETSLALVDERRRELVKRQDAAARALFACQAAAEPSAASFRELSEQLTHGAFALPAPVTRALLEAHTLSGSGELWAEARSKRELLLDRLSGSAAAAELLTRLRFLLEDDQRKAGGLAYLQAWYQARKWLGIRVPAQLADEADPLAALERLRDQLSALEHRLERQEADLRGASEDIARSIEVQLRRAGNQVRRLNQSLDRIAFGSIRGIRVRTERVERMARVLAALREGDAQELLFQPGLTIEEALSEVLRRYGGGRSGGQRILDYREYVELTVEILRQSSAVWEPANPTRLSTGEAIGVGAALMMVVLTEWERDANLLRGKRDHDSLRFLFLDEANRLSPDNLSVLFDLCQVLELQLLIAAPEVARAHGNTTYRLVRVIGDDGNEQVIVSGRRAASPAMPDATELEPSRSPGAQRSFGFDA